MVLFPTSQMSVFLVFQKSRVLADEMVYRRSEFVVNRVENRVEKDKKMPSLRVFA